ncbi:MAG: leucyl aminopeptidase [Alphaproteobacteria bacterium]|nr:leucyl aminopeptidase [Alphaproteobacteria bacterium]
MLEVIFTKDEPLKDVVKVIAMFEDKPATVEFLSTKEAKLVETAIIQANFEAKAGDYLNVYGGTSKIVLLGLGKNDDDLNIQGVGEKLFNILFNDENAYIVAENDQIAQNLAYGVLLGSYSFDKYKTEKKDDEYTKLEQISLKVDDVEKNTEEFKSYVAMANGIRYCKDLCNEPASYLTPEVFAYDIKRLEYLGLDVELLNLDAIHLKGLGLVEAVAKGSSNLPYVVIMSWRGNPEKNDYDLGLVGKGVCFDSGGVSLKSGGGMIEMKMDMTGAACVVASMKVAALQRIRKNIVAVVSLVENMPDGNAVKIGDIVTAYNGRTVEVLNADAEGRLIVADALAYMQKNFKVSKIVDLATLGTISAMFGNVYAGLFSNDEKLTKTLIAAGEKSGEKLWHLPMNEDYEKMIKSDVADIKNIPTGQSARITSVAFLNKFIEKGTKWAHIDISGLRLDKTGLSSGFGVKLLNEVMKGL